MKLHGMIFDMDGTLFDTERQYIETYHRIADERGLDLPHEFTLSCMGLPREEVCGGCQGAGGVNFGERWWPE